MAAVGGIHRGGFGERRSARITPIALPASLCDSATWASNHGDSRWPGSSIAGLPGLPCVCLGVGDRVAGCALLPGFDGGLQHLELVDQQERDEDAEARRSRW